MSRRRPPAGHERSDKRRHLAPSLRVALVATLAILAVYAAAVAVLDVFVSHRLVAEVDRQLAARLQVARSEPPRLATKEPEIAGGEGNYGFGIYGEPIYVWRVSASGHLDAVTTATPPLAPGSWPPAGSARTTASGGTRIRLQSVSYRGGLLVAGESLAELAHVESILELSELAAAPFIAIAAFLTALLIGLRSAAPIELARRRQIEFTADASHELRTPLTVIQAELALARGDLAPVGSRSPLAPGSPSGDERDATLERIGRESERLQRIVDDLLWLARFDSAPPSPGPERLDLVTIAAGCAERFEHVAAARSLEITVERLGDAPASLLAPPEWIDRLVGALVDNACKYASEGGAVRISVGRIGRRVGVVVEDSGPGIDDTLRSRLFDRFRRGTSDAGGHGLGLAIADSVVSATGGQWSVGDAGAPLAGARMEVSWPAR
jgi:signal transduction histidine kinase